MRVTTVAVMVALVSATAVAWVPGSIDFDIQPGGPGSDATMASANSPYLFLKDDLVAAALVDTSVGIAFGCLAHHKLNGGRCINSTLVYTDRTLSTSATVSQVLKVDDTSVIFVVSGVNESFAAHVDANNGVRWRLDRANSTGPVAYDAYTKTVVASVGPSSPAGFDMVQGFDLTQPTSTPASKWIVSLSQGVVPGRGVSSTQFSPAMHVFEGKAWFAYAETTYGIDVRQGPAAPQNCAVLRNPCGVTSMAPYAPVPGCPDCVVALHVNLVNPALGAVGRSMASIIVSGNTNATRQFHMCGLTAYADTNRTTIRFNTTDTSTVDVVAPFTATTDASSTAGARRHTVFFISARVTSAISPFSMPTLLAFDAASGHLLWADSRSAKDLYSLPVELQKSDSVGGVSVTYQLMGQLIAKRVDDFKQMWLSDATECSVTAAVEFEPTRIFCINGTAGVAAIGPPADEQSTTPVVLWGVSVPTRGRESNAVPQRFHSYNHARLVGVGLQQGRFMAVSEAAPPTTPAPTGTGTPNPKPMPTHPQTTGAPGPAPSDDNGGHKMSPGIVVLIVFAVIAVIGLAAGVAYRQWRLQKYRRRGAIDSALSYGGDGAGVAQNTQHSSVAAHGPQSGYGSLYV